jgi:glyoxylase-like metal-dependent hydrolase (beta-lactamase superfamily II)
VLALGDTFTRSYPNIDWSNGGGIDGMILANDRYLKAANDTTKIVPGHGPLATKANLQDFRDMLVTARDRVKKLFDEGKSEQEVIAADPLADLNTKWAAAQGLASGPIFLRNVYNSFRNHN